MAKLKDDHIRWYLDLDAKGVQGEIQKLSGSIVKLQNENKHLVMEIAAFNTQIKETEKDMRRLEKAGKDQSDQYRYALETYNTAKHNVEEYTNAIRENNKVIDDNTKKIDESVKAMKLEDMTMNQLKKRASELRTQLNATSKAADPEGYKKTEKALKDVEKQMGSLGDKTKNLCDIFNTMKGVLAATFATKALSKVKEWTKALIEFTKEGIKMAAGAQGVESAFSRFATSSDLKSLREDTKGLVNDLDLMKAAVRAENFNIPLNQLGKLLQFAQQRAKDTEQSVDYLVNSIVDGIGKKSVRIIDNLGISTSRLQEEIKKTGDFASSVGKIVDEEMSKIESSIDTAAEADQRKAVAQQNLQLALGRRFVGMKEGWDKFVTGFLNSLAKTVDPQNTAVARFDEQIDRVATLETEIPGLLVRYEELKSKTELNAEEQVELNKIMNSISETIPGVISEFDDYGNILSINTDKVNEYIKSQRDMLEYMHKDAINQIKKDIKEYEKLIRIYQTNLAIGGEQVFVAMNAHGPSETRFQAYSPDRIAELEKNISKYLGLLQGAKEHLDEISGKNVEDQTKDRIALIESRKKFNEMNQKELNDWIKAEEAAITTIASLGNEVFSWEKGLTPVEHAIGSMMNKMGIVDSNRMKILQEAQKIYQGNFSSGGGSGDDKKAQRELERIAEEQKRILSDMTIQMNIAAKAYNDRLKEAGLFGIELTKLTQEQLAERLRLDKEYQDKQTEIALKGEEDRFNNAKKKSGVDGDSTHFTEQQNKVLELLQQQHEANTQKIKDDSDKKQLATQKAYDSVTLASLQQSYQSQLEVIEASQKAKIISLQTELSEGLISRRQYEQEIENLESDSLAKRIVAQENYVEALKLLVNPTEEQQKELKEAEGALLDLQIQSNDEKLNQQEEFEKKKQSIREQYGLVSMSESYAAELELLKESLEEKLLTEEEFEDAKLKLKLKYAAEYAQKAADFASMASDAVSALMSAETANVEAKYDAEIAAAGDNAEEVERLENEKAQKKLDIEKKYADVQFAITAAEIVANTAMAIMQAYSQLGPIAGSVAAALMGITGAAQLVAANAQRQKVKQMTLSGSSSSSAPKTGQITVKDGFADGGSNTGDYTDGGYTGDGGRYDVAGMVPYHHGEYFVAVPEMKNPAVQDHVRAIDSIRRKRTNKNPLPSGFADGGANMPSSGIDGYQADRETNRKLLTLLNGLISGEIPFKTNYGVTELEAAQQDKADYESKFDLPQ